MLASIHPLGERARRSRWWLTVAAYVAGSVAGGTALGVIAGALGAGVHRMTGIAVGPPSVAVVAAVCVACAVLDLRRFAVLVPSWRRQVDEDWLHRYRGWVYGAGYGVQLGFGLVTIVTTAAVYGIAVLAAATGSVAFGAAAGATFGAARAIPVLAVGRVRRPDQLRRLHARLAAAAEPARAASSSAFVLCAVALLWVAR